MKLGLLYLKEIKYDDLAWVFVKNNIDAEIIDTDLSVHSTSKVDASELTLRLKASKVDVVITMNFCAAVSDACMMCGIKYVSWINDAPQQALFNKQIKNSCNYVFSFDKSQLDEIKKLGAKNAYHLPLATNVMRNEGLVVSEADISRYTCDVSFIGRLYSEDDYLKLYALMGEPTRSELDGIMANAFGRWDGGNYINGKLSETAVNELVTLCNYSVKDEFSMPADEYVVGKYLARKLAFDERVAIAKLLSKYDFRLYTSTQDVEIEGVDIWPSLKYDEELPKAYHLSRINLNITLHSITSGIPLRVFDIMGVGGFMLTNYQPEVEELFTIGTDIEVYKSLDELDDKVKYYLEHEDKRVKISLNGYRTVSEKYNYETAFKRIARAVGILF